MATPAVLSIRNSNILAVCRRLGIVFARSREGDVYVAGLQRSGNAARSGLVLPGDILRKTSAVFGDDLWDVEEYGRVIHAINSRYGDYFDARYGLAAMDYFEDLC